MNSYFGFETTGGKRHCAECGEDISKKEDVFIESYTNGMFVGKKSYHLECSKKVINDIIKRFNGYLNKVDKQLGEKSN